MLLLLSGNLEKRVSHVEMYDSTADYQPLLCKRIAQKYNRNNTEGHTNPLLYGKPFLEQQCGRQGGKHKTSAESRSQR